MSFTLNKFGEIVPYSIEKIKEQIDKRYEMISKLYRLYDPNISDEEYLEIIGSMYHLSNFDIHFFAKVLIGKPEVCYGSMCTTLVDPVFDPYYRKIMVLAYGTDEVTVCYDEDYDNAHYDRKYSLDELVAKVKNGEIVVMGIRYTSESVEDKNGKKNKIDVKSQRILESLDIHNISTNDFKTFGDLGVYKDLIMPYIKREFYADRIAFDIYKAISDTKRELARLQTSFKKSIAAKEAEIATLNDNITTVSSLSETFGDDVLKRAREKIEEDKPNK